MDVTILNLGNSKVDLHTESLLLFSSFLFTDRVHYGGMFTTFLTYRSYYKKLTDKQKILFFKDVIPPLMEKRDKKSIDETFSRLIFLQNKKHKTKRNINALKDFQKMIPASYKLWELHNTNELSDYNLLELIPFAEEYKELFCWILPANKEHREQFNEAFFTFINGSLYFPEVIHYICSESIIKDSLLNAKLFEMPEPITLSTSQIRIIRNDLLDKFKPFFESISKYNKELKEIEYNKKNLKKLKKEFLDKACEEKDGLQDAIDNNLYMNQLKNKLEEDKTLSIYLGLASFNNILEFYKNVNIIDDYIIMYVKDKMKDELSMKGSKFFLYLKTT